MKMFKILVLAIIIFIMYVPESKSFAPKGKDFGLGIIIGEPTGITAKYWTTSDNAFCFSLGNSYLGTLRLGIDYIWHFNAFNSNVVSLYAGPGIAVGFGESSGWIYTKKDQKWYKTGDEIGLGARGVFGINLIPRNTPLELFGEVGILVGFVPGTYSNVEGSLGFRFYF